MAITAAAKKAVKRSTFLRERNLTFKLAMKKAIKSFKKSVVWGDLDWAKWLLSVVYSTIDKARQRHIIHPNNAARKKKRLNNMLKVASI
jgi:small subunit ribosomal protein S20